MTVPRKPGGFAARPGAEETWIKAGDGARPRASEATAFTARLTVEITPELRGRIKIAAFRRGKTVADMLRDLLAREFQTTEGDPE